MWKIWFWWQWQRELTMWTCCQFFSPSVQFTETAAVCLPFHKDHWHSSYKLYNALLFRVLSLSFPRELRSTGVEVFAMAVQSRPALFTNSLRTWYTHQNVQVQAQEVLSVWFDLDISTTRIIITLIMNGCLSQGMVWDDDNEMDISLCSIHKISLLFLSTADTGLQAFKPQPIK